MGKMIGIIGLGYVGLPLAIEFGKKYQTYGYDINSSRIKDLKNGIDKKGEMDKIEIESALKLNFTTNIGRLLECDIYIISVPTPIDNKNNPDLKILLNATKIVGKLLKKNNIVIYESTVYPGCTEDDCVPILEKESGLEYNKDFFCGYSPERINPGDKEKTLTNITKITSGSNSEIAKIVDNLYSSIIKAGTYLASSIKIAEAAKVIENCQRDLNIAFVNELAMIFDKMNIDTLEVLEAAGTKWNFLPFRPGLVGGHCIGVDPYYLTYKSKEMGYNPSVILSGRKLNDSISKYICKNITRFLKNKKIKKAKILILGITFKGNCSDIRNSQVINIYNKLKKQKVELDVYDPYADKNELYYNHKIKLIDYNQIKLKYYDCILIPVFHNQFININIEQYCSSKTSLIYDIKGIYNNKNYLRL